MKEEDTKISDTQSQNRVGHRLWQRLFAEALGSFAIVFAGCGAIIANEYSNGAITHAGVAVAFGLVVATMIYALGPVSAAHFNPAVTIAFASVRRFPWRFVPHYLAAQCVGAFMASACHKFLLPDAAARAGYGATVSVLPLAQAGGVELFLTFFLMLVVMAVATDKRAPSGMAGVVIGGIVTLDAMWGGPLTGASMNPARSLAPALFAGGQAIAQWPLIYCLAPVAGALLAAWTYEALRDSEEHAQNAPPGLETPRGLDEALRREPGLSRVDL